LLPASSITRISSACHLVFSALLRIRNISVRQIPFWFGDALNAFMRRYLTTSWFYVLCFLLALRLPFWLVPAGSVWCCCVLRRYRGLVFSRFAAFLVSRLPIGINI
jgi:hypothetical protein